MRSPSPESFAITSWLCRISWLVRQWCQSQHLKRPAQARCFCRRDSFVQKRDGLLPSKLEFTRSLARSVEQPPMASVVGHK